MHTFHPSSVKMSSVKPTRLLIIAVIAIASMPASALATAAPPEVAGSTNGRIVFQRVFFARQTVALFTVDPDGSGLRQVTHPREGIATGLADWSPDGGKIAYRRSSSGSTGVHIFVMRADGTDRRDLSKGSCKPEVCQEEAPTWSPDGKHIAFHRAIGGAEPQIYVMRSDGMHRRQITSGASDWTPSWSLTGRFAHRLRTLVGEQERVRPLHRACRWDPPQTDHALVDRRR
jgi:hypothetical protein